MNKHVKTFYLIDLDRTLLDTDGASRELIRLVAEQDTSAAEFVQAHLKETATFGSQYSLHDSLKEVMGKERALAVEARFKERQAENQKLLRDGAYRVLDFIQGEGIAGGILTFGSEEGQRMKLTAIGLADVPAVVTQQSYKGQLMASWRQSDGIFQLPTEFGSVTAHELVLVDDREMSFIGLPEGAIGYWIPEGTPAALDEVPLSAHIRHIRTLDDFIALEKERTGRSN